MAIIGLLTHHFYIIYAYLQKYVKNEVIIECVNKPVNN